MKKLMTKAVVIPVLFALVFLQSCNLFTKDKKMVEPGNEFVSVISAYTTGIISKEATIRISLVESIETEIDPTEPIDEKLFQFSPKIKGKAFWLNNYTIEFRPEQNLPSGETIEASFYLGKIKEVEKGLKEFKFGFKIIEQSIAIETGTFSPYQHDKLSKYSINGTLRAADVLDLDDLNQLISVKQKREELPIRWISSDDRTVYQYVIDSVKRTVDEEKVIIQWNGDAIGIDQKGSEEVIIPALGDFKVVGIKVIQNPNQYIQLLFSDPVQQQSLEGLIYLKDNSVDFSYDIEDNIVKAFPVVRQDGSYSLMVQSGIKNVLGYRLPHEQDFELNFQAVKPAIRLVGKGVIMPNSSELLVPFEAVNLSAVDVSVIKIYENNVSQFLQENTLKGRNNLKRVGRLVGKQRVQLQTGTPLDLGKWNTFSVDVSKIVKPEPGAIYRIELNFKPSYSLYPCEEAFADEEEKDVNYDFSEPEELSYWDSWEGYYSDYDNYEYDDYYTYRDNRENPCSEYYYGKRRKVAQNILASNLGIIAKLGTDGSMKVAITNLLNTKPVKGATVKILDYQQQVIGNGETGADGLISLQIGKRVPFLLIASSGDQRGYLRLDDGSSLSLSRFDVSGQQVQKGVKAFLYGERGVWRPGDTLFFTFILEDKQNSIPSNHPVQFTLTDPTGKRVDKITRTEGENGFYHFRTQTKVDAKTGFYNAEVRIGALTFNKSVRVETIKPNRLKINFELDKEKLTADDKEVEAAMNVAWLHGAMARNLKCEVLYSFTSSATQFGKFSDYTFTDPSREYSGTENTLFTGRTNSTGYVKVSGTLKPGSKPKGMLNANFVTRVYEEGGDFSVNRFSIPYSPYQYYVGVKTPKGDKRGMLLTDTTQQIKIITVDEDGNPVSRKGLKATLHKVSWRWWWDASSDNVVSYEGSNYSSLIASETITTNNRGEGVFKIKVNYPDWGRYFIRIYDPVEGHATGKIVYIDWPGWAGKKRDEQPGGASMLIFNTDKEKYKVGERAYISLPGSDNARALVSLENGTKVLDAFWVENINTDTTVSFAITPQMAPNCYVNITLVQPHINTKNDHPIRLYGIVPIEVIDPQTKLAPKITMADEVRPENPFTVKVSETNGKKMTYTIAIVDEGLLDITSFKTPDAWEAFYAREALGVKTWDLYDMVLGAYGGEIAGIFSIGGGGEGDEGSKSKSANRFKPVVLYDGPYTLEAGQSKAHNFTMPNYIGSVKAMVIAGDNGAYGKAEKTVKVKSPLMVLATLPRVVGPTEKIKLPVTIFAMDDNVNNVVVKVSGNDLFSIPIESKKINFSEVGDQVIYFDLKVKENIGVGTILVEATSGSEKATYEVEIDVRNPNPPITKVYSEMVEAGNSWSKEFELIGMNGTNNATLELSTIPPIDLGRRLKYLIRYPHGCIEQTTSSVFPQLYLPDILSDNAAILNKIDVNINAGISRLKQFILPDGGFSYWPGHTYANEWGTNYAGHFLLEAERKGYSIPANFKNNWIKHQKKKARQWSETTGQSDQIQAYRLYTLALAKKYEIGSMNRLRQRDNLSLQARWLLAATYKLAGQDKIANELVAGYGTAITQETIDYATYGSVTRDMAFILEALTILDKRAEGGDLVKLIANKLSDGAYMSTQTTAYCLMAVSKYYNNGNKSGKVTFDFKFGTGKVTKGETRSPIAQIDIPLSTSVHSSVYLKNTSNKILFARIINTGTPAKGTEEAAEKNVTMKVTYVDMENLPLSVTSLEQGTNFKVKVRITNTSPGKVKDIALSQIFPSGWEIHNSRLDNNTEAFELSSYTYQDIRDDRVYTYFDLNPGETKTYQVLLNAAYLGSYYLPAVLVEAMYDNEIFSHTKGQDVKVVEPVY